jgi:hypothetical protein
MAEKKPKAKPAKKEKKAPLPALDRCRAVLSVWSERRKPSQICQSLDIKWAVLQNWEQRALEGMMRALQPRRKQAPGPMLSERLVKLLKKSEAKEGVLEDRLERRLTKIQESKSGKLTPLTSSLEEKKKG